MIITNYITVNPNICHGKPCFKGTRIMVYLALEMLQAGASIADIQEAYPVLTPKHIKAALEFAARAVETGRYDAALMTPHQHAIPGR